MFFCINFTTLMELRFLLAFWPGNCIMKAVKGEGGDQTWSKISVATKTVVNSSAVFRAIRFFLTLCSAPKRCSTATSSKPLPGQTAQGHDAAGRNRQHSRNQAVRVDELQDRARAKQFDGPLADSGRKKLTLKRKCDILKIQNIRWKVPMK